MSEKKDPRNGVCNFCRAVRGEVNGQIGIVYKRSHLHHETYNENDPFAHTIESCPACHHRIHWESLTRDLQT
jgi:hypothetical protein